MAAVCVQRDIAATDALLIDALHGVAYLLTRMAQHTISVSACVRQWR
jgi:hypothetical protein